MLTIMPMTGYVTPRVYEAVILLLPDLQAPAVPLEDKKFVALSADPRLASDTA